MKYSFGVFAASLMFSVSMANASTQVKIIPANPVDCRQSDELRVMTVDESHYSEDEKYLYLHVEASRQNCALGGYRPMPIRIEAEHGITLMRDGFKFPWDYRAPATTVAYKVSRAGGDVIVADFTLDKDELFAEKSKREFELFLRTDFGQQPYIWSVILKKGNNGLTQVILKQK